MMFLKKIGYFGSLCLVVILGFVSMAQAEDGFSNPERSIFIKVLFSRPQLTNLDDGLGGLVAIEFAPSKRFSVGWMNQVHHANFNGGDLIQWLSTVNLRGYRTLRFWDRFHGGVQTGLGLGLRDGEDRFGDLQEWAFVWLFGPGFVIDLYQNVGLTGSFLFHLTSFENDEFFMTFNPGIHLAF